MKKIISVNRSALRAGAPPISVKARGETIAATHVEIFGPSTIRWEPDKKRQPRVWIETNHDIELIAAGGRLMLL
jgi:hypothetical protein